MSSRWAPAAQEHVKCVLIRENKNGKKMTVRWKVSGSILRRREKKRTRQRKKAKFDISFLIFIFRF